MQSSGSAVAAIPESAADNTTAPIPAVVGTALAAEPSAFIPLALGLTDVHLLGQLTIESRYGRNEIVRKMVQSFQTPELSVSYRIAIGIHPRNGTLKEDFNQSGAVASSRSLWGRGGRGEKDTSDGVLGGADLARDVMLSFIFHSCWDFMVAGRMLGSICVS
jgi:hypothetical protein